MAKQILRENTLVPARMVEKLDLPLLEETVKGTPYKALAIYRFPFTRPGQKNLNGRIYPYALWDKVFREFKSRSTLCLMDHPEDGPGDPTRVWAVARNPRYSDDRTLAYVDCYIIDNEHGRTINGVLEAGGDIGLSTSGIGDFEPDGITVCPESYELERFFDAVLQPSYSVFGSLDDKISESEILNLEDNEILEEDFKFSIQRKDRHAQPIPSNDPKIALKYKKNGFRVFMNGRDKELTLKDLLAMQEEEDNEIYEENPIDNFGDKKAPPFTKDDGGKKKENLEGIRMTLREKRELEASFKRIYEDVKEIKDFRERLSRAKEALTFYEDTEVESYKKEFEELVREAEQEFEDALSKGEKADEAIKEADAVKEEAEDIKEENEKLKKENDELKKENEEINEYLNKVKQEYREAINLVDNVAQDIRRKVPYTSYEELREYAIKATKLYTKVKAERDEISMNLANVLYERKAMLEEVQLQQKKEQLAKARAEEARREREMNNALAEQRMKEAQEKAFLDKVNPDVLEYYNDTVARLGESITAHRTQILSKRTVNEAQLYVLKALRPSAPLEESVQIRDIAVPIPVTNCRQVYPDPQLNLPKGYI